MEGLRRIVLLATLLSFYCSAAGALDVDVETALRIHHRNAVQLRQLYLTGVETIHRYEALGISTNSVESLISEEVVSLRKRRPQWSEDTLRRIAQRLTQSKHGESDTVRSVTAVMTSRERKLAYEHVSCSIRPFFKDAFVEEGEGVTETSFQGSNLTLTFTPREADGESNRLVLSEEDIPRSYAFNLGTFTGLIDNRSKASGVRDGHISEESLVSHFKDAEILEASSDKFRFRKRQGGGGVFDEVVLIPRCGFQVAEITRYSETGNSDRVTVFIASCGDYVEEAGIWFPHSYDITYFEKRLFGEGLEPHQTTRFEVKSAKLNPELSPDDVELYMPPPTLVMAPSLPKIELLYHLPLEIKKPLIASQLNASFTEEKLGEKLSAQILSGPNLGSIRIEKADSPTSAPPPAPGSSLPASGNSRAQGEDVPVTPPRSSRRSSSTRFLAACAAGLFVCLVFLILLLRRRWSGASACLVFFALAASSRAGLSFYPETAFFPIGNASVYQGEETSAMVAVVNAYSIPIVLGLKTDSVFVRGLDTPIRPGETRVVDIIAGKGSELSSLRSIPFAYDAEGVTHESALFVVLHDSSESDLSFECQDVFNFGTAVPEAAIEAEWRITNTGKIPLILKEPKTQCGCTTVVHPACVLLPGKDEIYRGIVNLPKSEGSCGKKVVSIPTNCSRNPIVEFQVQGDILAPFRVSASRDTILRGKETEISVRLKFSEAEYLDKCTVVLPVDGSIALIGKKNQSPLEVLYEFRGKIPLEERNEKIEFQLEEPKYSYPLFLQSAVSYDFQVVPPAVDFSCLASPVDFQTGRISRRLLIQAEGTDTPELLSWSCENKSILVEPLDSEKESSHSIYLNIKLAELPKVNPTKCTLVLNVRANSKDSEVQVPVSIQIIGL